MYSQVGQISVERQIKVRNLLRNTYTWMALGLALTGVVALFSASSPMVRNLLIHSPFVMIGAVIAEIALVFYLSARIMSMTTQRASLIFIIYSILNGFTLSVVLMRYTGASVAQTFFVASGAFGGMSLYALVTKKDLTGMGKYLFMGLWGLIIMSIMGMFFRGSGFSMMISLVGLILFMALTAYDTQIIRRWSDELSESSTDEDYVRLSIIGALKLYLDFINIFLYLLRFMGRRN